MCLMSGHSLCASMLPTGRPTQMELSRPAAQALTTGGKYNSNSFCLVSYVLTFLTFLRPVSKSLATMAMNHIGK